MQPNTKTHPFDHLAVPARTLLAGALLAVGLSGCSLDSSHGTSEVSDPVVSNVESPSPASGTVTAADDTCNPGGGCPR